MKQTNIDILVADPVLAKEIEYDLKIFKANQQKEQKEEQQKQKQSKNNVEMVLVSPRVKTIKLKQKIKQK